ncbi:hypothetical protein BU24DRAFT_488057 [Aaosphaeria arxii CBS 175.79]|uniref:Uncharacterized protein n=1 Tax=Aaosphaeria arxii CBS 175.79 TaxID=1450172 RepID=A0A6A5Y8X9_9PLEO|nr:uncharacterized protein BU24DRAFT_488057 [Aaosphaeria arxii CBS 175.79]KAF2021683.1 hypothetical protein BU24DRAFT_488057 [Aaosphaeria arxii CBS 175.79]
MRRSLSKHYTVWRGSIQYHFLMRLSRLIKKCPFSLKIIMEDLEAEWANKVHRANQDVGLRSKTKRKSRPNLKSLTKATTIIVSNLDAEWANKAHRANQERDEKNRLFQKTQDSLQRMRQENHGINTNLKNAHDEKESMAQRTSCPILMIGFVKRHRIHCNACGSMALKLKKVEKDLDDMSRLAEEYSTRIEQIQSAGLEERFEVERRGFLDRITTLEEKKSQLEEAVAQSHKEKKSQISKPNFSDRYVSTLSPLAPFCASLKSIIRQI